MGTVYPFPRRATEPRLTKRQLAMVHSRGVRWAELRIAEGMPSMLIGARRYFLLSETEPWLEARKLGKYRGRKEAGDKLNCEGQTPPAAYENADAGDEPERQGPDPSDDEPEPPPPDLIA